MQRSVGFLVRLFLPLLFGICPTSSVYAELVVTGTPIAAAGNFYGYVVLEDGSHAPGVTVTIEGNGEKFTTVTNKRGDYRFLNKPAGNYTLTFELEGFGTVTKRNMPLAKGRPPTLITVMRAGAAPGGNSTPTYTSRSAGSMERSKLESIPATRDPFSLLNATPGVLVQGAAGSVPPSEQKIDDIVDPQINSSNRRQLTELKDDLKAAQGKDAKLAVLSKAQRELAELKKAASADGAAGFFLNTEVVTTAENVLQKLEAYFNSAAYNPAQDMAPGVSRINIRGDFYGVNAYVGKGLGAYDADPLLAMTLSEVTVNKGVTAEYGRFTGGVINVITKSGGKDFTGLLRVDLDDEWETSPRTDTNSYFEASALGGPIVKDKLWFFASYGTLNNQNNPLVINNQTSNNSYSIEAAGQSTTLEPGSTTTFNPNPEFFTGFYSAPFGGMSSYPSLTGQVYDGFFYPGTDPNTYISGFGGTTVINPDFADPGVLDNWDFLTTGRSTDRAATEEARRSLEYLFDTSWGDHALKFGVETVAPVQAGRYSGILSGSNFRLLAGSTRPDPRWGYAALGRGSQEPGAGSSGSYNAGAYAGRNRISSGNSFYTNDSWQLNDKWSFNIGVRFDEGRGPGTDGDSSAQLDSEFITPRLGSSYDLRGDGEFRLDTTYAQYAGKYSESQFQGSQSTTGGSAWDGTFNFDAGSRGMIVPGGGGNFRAYYGGSDLNFYLNDQFIFNRGPITTRSFFGHGDQGFGFFNNTVDINFEYTGRCSELLTEADLEEIIEDYKDYLDYEWDEYYPVGPGTCGGRLNLRTYQQEFAFLMREDADFRDFFEDWESGYPPPRIRLKLKFIEPRFKFTPTAPSRGPGVLPDDAFYQSSGSAQKKVDDQWGLKRIGFKPATRDGNGMIWPERGTPTIVAVVDSGIDLTHPELQGQLWANFEEIPNNGKDDDSNGLVDDVFGWNFADFNGDVFDLYGHGTFIAGIIGAATDNGIGIAGINPWARIMPVKVSTYHGRSNNIRIAQGIYYAAEMGARVINVSFEGDVVSKVIQTAVDHAADKGALVVVAAGNRSIDVAGVSPAVMRGALTVAAIGPDGIYEKYSNHGAAVDIAAPGTHIISLRASRTDLMQFEDRDYAPGSNILGEGDILYHLSGTSFAAPHVAGVASLLFSMNPDLTAAQVKRMILQSTRDIGTVGTDRLTGYGELDAAAALQADPEYYVDALIDSVELAGAALRVNGTAAANRLRSAWIELGKGEQPESWKAVGKKVKRSVAGGVLTEIDVNELRGSATWTLQLVVEHKNGTRRLSRYRLDLG